MKKLLLLFAALTAVSCTIGVTEETTSSPYPAIVVHPYITGENNGTPFAFKEDDTGDYFCYASQSYIGSDMKPSTWFYYGMYLESRVSNPIGQNYSISFKNMVNSYKQDEPNLFYDAFDHTPTNFISDQEFSNNVRGVEVSFTAFNSATTYSSLFGNQSGSSMTITSVTRSVMPGGNLPTEIIKGTFNCKLYQMNNPTQFITISNADFLIRCQAYY